jgi:chromosome segregation ATPase
MIELEDYDDDLTPEQAVVINRLVRSSIAAEKEVMALRARVAELERDTETKIKEGISYYTHCAFRQADRIEHMEAQIKALADVLIEEFGGPTQSESACEMAVRVLREQYQEIERLRGASSWSGLDSLVGDLNAISLLANERKERIEELEKEVNRLTWRVNADARAIEQLEKVRDERTALVKRLRTTLRDKERENVGLGQWNQKYVTEHQENKRLGDLLQEAREASVDDRMKIARLEKELADARKKNEEYLATIEALSGTWVGWTTTTTGTSDPKTPKEAEWVDLGPPDTEPDTFLHADPSEEPE